MQRRTVLLISSSAIGWADLRTVLETADEFAAVGEATTARRAIDLAAKLQPHVIIASATVDGGSSVSLLLDLRHRVSPMSKVVVFATHLDANDFSALAETTFDGYLLWSDLTPEALRRCLDAVIVDDVVVSTRTVARVFVSTQCRPQVSPPESVWVTERERIILRHLADGLSRQETAAVEIVSLRTVERIVSDLEAKLDAPNSFVLGMKATQLGLIP